MQLDAAFDAGYEFHKICQAPINDGTDKTSNEEQTRVLIGENH
jgi:hypothetical protein